MKKERLYCGGSFADYDKFEMQNRVNRSGTGETTERNVEKFDIIVPEKMEIQEILIAYTFP